MATIKVTNQRTTFNTDANPDYNVAVNAGNVDDLTQRCVLANNVALPPGNNKIGKVDVDTLSGRTPVNEFAESAAVVSTVETTILTYVSGAGFYVQGLLVTGQAAGRFALKVNGVTKAIVRTTAAKMTESIFYGEGVLLAASASVTITGYHEETANQALAANLFGYSV